MKKVTLRTIPVIEGQASRLQDFTPEIAEGVLNKSKEWELVPGQNLVFNQGRLFTKGQEPKSSTPTSVVLENKEGGKKEFTDIDLAAKVLVKSQAKKIWTLAPGQPWSFKDGKLERVHGKPEKTSKDSDADKPSKG